LETYLNANNFWKFHFDELKLLFEEEEKDANLLQGGFEIIKEDDSYYITTMNGFKKNPDSIYYISIDKEKLKYIHQKLSFLSKSLFDSISQTILEMEQLVEIDILKVNPFYKNNIETLRKAILHEFHIMIDDDDDSTDNMMKNLKINLQHEKEIQTFFNNLKLLKKNEALFIEIELIQDVIVKYKKHSSLPTTKVSVLSSFPLTKRFHRLKKEMKMFYDVVYNTCIINQQHDVDELKEQFTNLEIYSRFQKATRQIRSDPSKWMQLKSRFPIYNDEKVKKLILGVYLFNDFF
jgi:hypothetical protein